MSIRQKTDLSMNSVGGPEKAGDSVPGHQSSTYRSPKTPKFHHECLDLRIANQDNVAHGAAACEHETLASAEAIVVVDAIFSELCDLFRW